MNNPSSSLEDWTQIKPIKFIICIYVNTQPDPIKEPISETCPHPAGTHICVLQLQSSH